MGPGTGGRAATASAAARVISQAVHEATIIEDSREMQRPSRIGGSEPGPGAAPPPAHAADPALPMVLTPDELAKMLRVRRRSVYEAIARGDIPGVRRIGRKVRIDRDSVLAWMADGHGRAPRSSRR
jgi:excisionase family DNA binding protein